MLVQEMLLKTCIAALRGSKVRKQDQLIAGKYSFTSENAVATATSIATLDSSLAYLCLSC